MINSLPTPHQNQPNRTDLPPPPHLNGTGRRRFSVKEDFHEGHNLWHPGYDGYLEAAAREVVVEASNGNSTDDFIDAQIGEKRGFIPKTLLDNA